MAVHAASPHDMLPSRKLRVICRLSPTVKLKGSHTLPMPKVPPEAMKLELALRRGAETEAAEVAAVVALDGVEDRAGGVVEGGLVKEAAAVGGHTGVVVSVRCQQQYRRRDDQPRAEVDERTDEEVAASGGLVVADIGGREAAVENEQVAGLLVVVAAVGEGRRPVVVDFLIDIGSVLEAVGVGLVEQDRRGVEVDGDVLGAIDLVEDLLHGGCVETSDEVNVPGKQGRAAGGEVVAR